MPRSDISSSSSSLSSASSVWSVSSLPLSSFTALQGSGSRDSTENIQGNARAMTSSNFNSFTLSSSLELAMNGTMGQMSA